MIYSMPLTMTLSMPLKSVLQCIFSLAALTVARASNTMCANLCRAPAGYEVAASGSTILRCPANHFHNGTGMLCTRCPSPSTFSAEIGLKSVSACHCSAGFHRVAGECTACEHGSYKAEIGDGFASFSSFSSCKACPAHMSTLLTASTHVSECVCVPGFELVGGECQQMSCTEASVLVVSRYTASCQCSTGFEQQMHNGFDDDVLICSPCRDGTFKDSVGNGKCSTCGPNTVSTGPRANRTACACSPGFEPGVQDGPDVEGGSCVAECGPGEEGRQGLCSACKSGQFKNVSGEKCFSCPAAQSASATGNTQESRCSCPYNTIDVQAADMTVIERLGPFLQDSIQSITAENTLLRAPRTSFPLFRLLVVGAQRAVTVTVGGRLVFQCSRATCSPTTLDLSGMRGIINATASAEDHQEATIFTLQWYTRREVVLRDNPQLWWSAAASRAEEWAASGNLRSGGAVFSSRNVFSSAVEKCLPCPVNLRCAAYMH